MKFETFGKLLEEHDEKIKKEVNIRNAAIFRDTAERMVEKFKELSEEKQIKFIESWGS